MKQIIITLWLLFLSTFATAGEKKPENWPRSPIKELVLHSDILGRNLLIQIQLPLEYENGSTSYPVLYCLDGKILRQVLGGVAHGLQLEQKIPRLITVGIDAEFYSKKEWWQSRSLLFTPTQSNKHESGGIREENTGGGDTFLRSLGEEVIPFVENQFRTEPNNRALLGYSLGGLFGLHVLFHEKDLFQKYLLISPSLSWDDRLVFKYEEEYARSHEDMEAIVFASMGSEENYDEDANHVDQLQALTKIIQSRNYPGLRWTAQVFEDEGHISTIPFSISKGLRKLFEERSIAEQDASGNPDKPGS